MHADSNLRNVYLTIYMLSLISSFFFLLIANHSNTAKQGMVRNQLTEFSSMNVAVRPASWLCQALAIREFLFRVLLMDQGMYFIFRDMTLPKSPISIFSHCHSSINIFIFVIRRGGLVKQYSIKP